MKKHRVITGSILLNLIYELRVKEGQLRDMISVDFMLKESKSKMIRDTPLF
jgi:hypothetical protein